MKKELFQETRTILLGALALVAGLAWNEAIKNLFSEIFSTSLNIIALFSYAILVTTIVVIITYTLKNMK
ncbi:MAG: DUF5654 family protein [Nanoarchaeota archaeon]|nr:DUF5654 family protein [Nanoarchaeota archaeon]